MVIISKTKDYYDYLQGVLGRDETLVLDRNIPLENKECYSYFLSEQLINPVRVTILIREKMFRYIVFKNKLYTSFDEVDFFDRNRKAFSSKESGYYKIINPLGNITYSYLKREFFDNKSLSEEELIKFKAKEKYNSLITAIIGTGKQSGSSNDITINYPILEKLFFPKVMDAYTIWNHIYDALCKEKEIINQIEQTDKEKIQSKGFDAKTSFRNIK